MLALEGRAKDACGSAESTTHRQQASAEGTAGCLLGFGHLLWFSQSFGKVATDRKREMLWPPLAVNTCQYRLIIVEAVPAANL